MVLSDKATCDLLSSPAANHKLLLFFLIIDFHNLLARVGKTILKNLKQIRNLTKLQYNIYNYNKKFKDKHVIAFIVYSFFCLILNNSNKPICGTRIFL